jgi:EAL domain-containing protein (putative c-di-GMP-specific phosphodiesterase class I)
VDLMQAVSLLRPLHDHGIRVSIDDFGTGYTSLAAIPHLPLDEIKVDMSFVKNSLTSRADEAIVRSVRELAHRLGLVSVAEGVEDAAIERLMVDIGFDLLQGYHFAKPLSEEALLEYVRVGDQARRVPA